MDKKNNEKLAKKIQCCIGILFLIPPVLGVLLFIIDLFVDFRKYSYIAEIIQMNTLSSTWSTYGQGMSSTPLYFGIMALVGAYLIKDNLKYFFEDK